MCNYKLNCVLAVCLILIIGSLSPTAAATVFVNWNAAAPHTGASWGNAFLTVQEGIDSAEPGDEVWVAAGTYDARITFKDGIAVYGGFAGNEGSTSERDCLANETILTNSYQGIVFPAGVGESTKLDGFTAREVRNLGLPGIECRDSSPTISNNRIVECGIYLNNSDAKIIGNRIAGKFKGKGRGIWSVNSCPTIVGNVLDQQIVCEGGSPQFIGNRVIGVGGEVVEHRMGAIHLTHVDSNSVVASNFIVANTFSGNFWNYGGGVYIDSSSPRITNNTIVGNAAWMGGGIYLTGTSSPSISNNIIAFNSSGIVNDGDGVPTLRSNCIYNPEEKNYIGLSAGIGDTSVNPDLVAWQFGELHLQEGSPCIDAGFNTASGVPALDIDGGERIVGEAVDMGADEFDAPPSVFSPLVVRVSESGNDDNAGDSWDRAKATVQAAIDAAYSAGGGEVWVAAGNYSPIELKSFVYVYGGFAGTESDREGRDWKTNQTILEGPRDSLYHGDVVRISYVPGYRFCSVDGFTIKGGQSWIWGYPGGGICVEGAWPIIENNLITENGASFGGGIGSSYPSGPYIVNNTISRNTSGSGIYLGNMCCAFVSGNIITKNVGREAGGISLLYNLTSTKIVNNLITNNSGWTGGIHCRGGGQIIANNTIVGNTSTERNGAVYLDIDSQPGPTLFFNNIVAYNSSGITVFPGLGGSPVLMHNNVFNPEGVEYEGILPGIGDFSAEPLFVNIGYGDYRLLWNSPCVDAGTNEDAPLVDLWGNLRPVDGDSDGTAITDVGAHEYSPLIVAIEVNPKSIRLQPNQMLTVHILGSEDFDVRTIDPTSVRFGPGEAMEVHGQGHWEDANKDGVTDLVMHFRCHATGISQGDTCVSLYGYLTSGEQFTGSCPIRTLTTGKK